MVQLEDVPDICDLGSVPMRLVQPPCGASFEIHHGKVAINLLQEQDAVGDIHGKVGDVSLGHSLVPRRGLTTCMSNLATDILSTIPSHRTGMSKHINQ